MMLKDIESLEFKYEGDRFNSGRLPVVLLSDLQAFREMLIVYAKDEWKKRNPSAKELGKSFDERVGIDLVSITNKCALLKLETTIDNLNNGLDFTDEELIKSASIDVMNFYHNANKGIIPKKLHTRKFKLIKTFGKHLKPDEVLVIGSNDNGESIYIDQITRNRIIENVLEVKEERIYGRAHLFGAQIDGCITIDTPEYGRISVKIPGDFKIELVRDAPAVVCYDLKVKLNEDHQIKGKAEVVKVSIMTEENLKALDYSLSKIGSVQSATRIAKDSAKRIIEQRPIYADKFVPTSNGEEGIIFEFTNNGWLWSIEMNSKGPCEIYGIEINGPSELEPVSFERADDGFIDFIDQKIGG